MCLYCFSIVQSLSPVQLSHPMDCCMPDFPVPHSLLEFAQVRVHWSGDVIQPSHPLSPLSSAFNLSRIRVFSRLFTSGGQSIRASASVLPMSIQGLFPLGLTDLTSFCPRGSWESSPAPQFKSINSSVLCLLDGPTLTSIHGYWKDHSPDDMDLCWQSVMSLLFNTLSRFVIAFLPRSSHLLISRLQSPSAVILEPKKRKSVTASTFSPSICHEVVGPDAMTLVFLILGFKLAFWCSSFTFIWRRVWEPSPVFLLGESHGQRSLAGCSP